MKFCLHFGAMKRNIASIYIHWPFCTKLCNYCNFNKYVNTDSKLPNQLVKCLKIEGKTILKKANINKISTIYFGGGTPSLIPPEKIKEVIDEYLEGTVFENHRKSLIQHCERSELRLHFEWTKVN